MSRQNNSSNSGSSAADNSQPVSPAAFSEAVIALPPALPANQAGIFIQIPPPLTNAYHSPQAVSEIGIEDEEWHSLSEDSGPDMSDSDAEPDPLLPSPPPPNSPSVSSVDSFADPRQRGQERD